MRPCSSQPCRVVSTCSSCRYSGLLTVHMGGFDIQRCRQSLIGIQRKVVRAGTQLLPHVPVQPEAAGLQPGSPRDRPQSANLQDLGM